MCLHILEVVLQDVYFTSNWFLRHPTAVKRHRLRWDDELGKAVLQLPNKRLALLHQSVDELLFDEVKLKPLVVDPLDHREVRSSAYQAKWYGKRTGMRDGRWLQIDVPYSGSAVLWRQRPTRNFVPVLRGRVLSDKIILQMDIAADDWQEMVPFLDPLFEQARAVLPLHQSYIDENNAVLKQYVPRYVEEQRAYIDRVLEAYLR